MARAIISNKVIDGDIQKLKELHKRINPGTPTPDFGAKDSELMLMRDEDDPGRIVGYILMEHALEVRAICTDPDFELRQQVLSHAVSALETRIRCGDLGAVNRFYVSVPTSHHHVHKYYKDEMAEVVDQNSVRYMKKLR